jgi:hypothetical protein
MGTVYLGGIRTKQDLDKSDEWFDKAIKSDKTVNPFVGGSSPPREAN